MLADRLHLDEVALNLRELLGQLLFQATGDPWVSVALLLLVLALVGLLVWRFSRGMAGDPGAAATGLEGRPRAAVDWRAEAEAHERAGRWRQAVRCHYRALLAELAQRGVVEEVPGRTTGEYRAQVGARAPALAPPFASATELFELAWYGERPTGPEEAARLRALAQRLVAGVGA